MRGERQMNKNSQRLEDGASGSPYVNRCGEYTIEVEFAGSSSLESCIAAYLNENIELHKNKTFDFASKTDDLEKKSKISKIFFENCIPKRPCGFLLV